VHLQVATTVTAPIDQVWAALVDWESQSQWMLDARDVRVVGPRRSGEGVTIHVPTTVLGVPVLDIMRITGWDPPHRLEATHIGRVVKGVGAFELVARTDEVTDVVWWEEIVAPFGRLGALGARAILPVLRAVFLRSLRRFRDHAEGFAAGTAA
jgi:uncharacterized protein YndB with AHSA1/START domain